MTTDPEIRGDDKPSPAAWRSIPARDVQWDATPGVARRVCWNIYRQCQPPSSGLVDKDEVRWHEKTLGNLADMGERQWRREITNAGDVTIEAIKLTIDYAAAGHCVTLKRDAYTPRPWRGGAVTDYPIIFSAPMVRALLDGRKTMTRRKAWRGGPKSEGGLVRVTESKPTIWQRAKAGDRLWVREAWCLDRRFEKAVLFRADDSDEQQKAYPIRYRSPIHMTRWASRITLVVTAAKMERLQEISEDDSVAEGCHRVSETLASHMFRDLWLSLYDRDSWDANPEVVVISFAVHKLNIDTMGTA